MFRPLLAATSLAMIVAAAAPASAAPCKDAKGRFTQCPPVASKAPTRCKDAKGKFAKCGTPGAVPLK
jgi:hypothetical protein